MYGKLHFGILDTLSKAWVPLKKFNGHRRLVVTANLDA